MNALESADPQSRPRENSWIAVVFLVLAFLIGGGSRADIVSHVILRPFAACVAVFGLYRLTRRNYERFRALLWLLGLTGALTLLHLVPLPPSVFQLLPGREVIRALDAELGLWDAWRPLTLSPAGTINALFSLLIPSALLLNLLDRSAKADRRLLLALLVLGFTSGLVGAMQMVGGSNSALYFYRITNREFAVGFFANRNHHAMVLACLFPLLAAYASLPSRHRDSARLLRRMAVVVGIATVPVILATGSRMGLVLAIIGICSVFWIYRPAASGNVKTATGRTSRFLGIAGIAALIVALAAASVLQTRSSVFERFQNPSESIEDIRFQVWHPIWEIGLRYFPFGTGIGSFPEAYRIYEPSELIRRTYLNHAHNDFLEIFMTSGLPGMLLLGAFIFCVARRMIYLVTSSSEEARSPIARAAAVVIVLLALGSITDYPVRTPSIACILVIAIVWLWTVDRQPRNTARLP